jgi:hypothetical protein
VEVTYFWHNSEEMVQVRGQNFLKKKGVEDKAKVRVKGLSVRVVISLTYLNSTLYTLSPAPDP